jgi:predicted permease
VRTPLWLRLLVRALPVDARSEVLRELLEQRATAAGKGFVARCRWAVRQPLAVLAWKEAAPSDSWFGGTWNDLQVARRSLTQRPALSMTVILTVAVSVAAIAGVASIIDAVLLRPLPYPDEDRLVWLATYQPIGSDSAPFDPAKAASAYGNPLDVADWAARERTLHALTPFETFEGTVMAGDRPIRVGMASVWATVGEVLGIRPAYGRLFTVADYAPDARVIVLSHRLWRTAFGGDPSIVGRMIDLGGARHEVIGILPDLPVPFPASDSDVWFPLAPPAADFQNRGGSWQRIVARLDRNVTLGQAREDFARIAHDLETEYPKTNENRRVFVVPYREGLVGGTREVIGLLAGAVALVLISACFNVGHLLLVSAQGRQRELAVRAALGARPGRVARLLLIESLWLAGLGGIAGLVMAPWALRGFVALYPETLPSVGEVAVRWIAVGAAILATAIAAVLAVIPPLLGARTRQLPEALRSSERGGEHRGQRRTRGVLVVSQVALSTALLIGGGLLVRTFLAMRATDPGFAADGVLTFNISLSSEQYKSVDDEVRFYDALFGSVQRMPNVQAAGMSTLLPFAPGEFGDGFYRVGFNDVAPNIPIARLQNVTAGYFDAIGLALIKGRLLTAADGATSPPAVIVNETLERRDFPGGALGRQIRFRNVTHEIVGVVRDKRHRTLRETPRAEMYYPRAQVAHPRYLGWVAVRTSGDPMMLVPEIRNVITSLDRNVAIDKVDTLRHRVDEVLAPDRFRATLIGLLAVVAVTLAGLGLYGLVAYSVNRDARTIAIRMALGADGGQAAGSVIRQVLSLTMAGVALGGALAWGGHSLLTNFLAGVSPFDPATLIVVGLLLLAIAIVSAAGPAVRASRVDPASVLRSQ